MSMRSADPGEYLATAGGDAAEAISLIDRYSNFDGTYRSQKDLRIDGEVKGTIECEGTVFVAQGARVNAKIQAASVTIAGELDGEVECRGRLQIMPSGRVRGRVTTDTLVVNEGAFYEGQLVMAQPDQRLASKPAPRPIASIAGGNGGGAARLEGRPPARPTGGEPSSAPSLPPSAPAAAVSPTPGPSSGPSAGLGNTGPGTNPSSTFIRRFGGPEQPWEGEGDEPAPGDRDRERDTPRDKQRGTPRDE